MSVVRLPAPLRAHTDGADGIAVPTGTVAAVLGYVSERFPALRRHLFADDGALRSYVNVFVNEDDIRDREGLDTPVREGDTVTVLPSIAGGETQAEPPELSPAEVARYSRHLLLPEIGRDGQRRLKAARVLIVGAGGLGSPAALYLAAAGVGTIGIVEFDVVDATNLQRQLLYEEGDIGDPKIDAAVRRLRSINPHIEVRPHPTRLSRANALAIIGAYDIVLDGTDNFATRYLLNDACVLSGKPYVYGAIFRFEGQVSIFAAPGAPCYRCLFREPPPPGAVPDCAEAGVLGVLPGIIGSMQALETIKWITGAGETLAGRLLIFDALAPRWRELRLRRDPDCPICGPHPTIHDLIDYEEFCGVTTESEHLTDLTDDGDISVLEFKQRFDDGEHLTLIDVREPFEWQIANLEPFGARLVPLAELNAHLQTLDPDQEIVLHCRSGHRSERAARMLRAAGFRRVRNLAGGILAWADAIDPTLVKY
ncbi:MAG: molybdopterin-synthase adenylyltransferase MoeB [Longimicrobiales bacterium]